MSLEHALAGIRVLDLSRLLPGPYLTMILGDMGADVVKIEAPHVGDYLRPMPPAKGGMSGRFLAVNRNKRSLVLDLKSEPQKRALLRMAERADVLVESFRPGVMDRLGLGYETLAARNPGIVVCSISGYGQTGPYRERAGHDINYVGLSGVLAMGGQRGGSPAMPGIQIADIAGGALWSATGILGALVGRARTGKGAHIDISMTEGALALLASEIGNLDCDLPEPPSRGNQTLNGGLACYRVYRTRDDKYLSVGPLEPKFWIALNRALGRRGSMGELAAPPARQDAIAEELAAIFAQKTRAEWLAILAEHDCCCEPVLEMDELAEHPLHQARQVFFEIEDPSDPSIGRVRQVRTPVGAPRARYFPPRLGEHGREVLAEYGFSDDEIAALIQ